MSLVSQSLSLTCFAAHKLTIKDESSISKTVVSPGIPTSSY